MVGVPVAGRRRGRGRLVGIPVGAAASRLRGPYLAGATLAFAVGLPALADKFPAFLGGENGLSVNPPTSPHWLGSNFPLERWEAWIACGGALVVVFVLYNLTHSAVGRSWRAVRDDEIAASLSGLRVGRRQTLAFVVSAACAGLGGGLLAAVLQLASPGAFPLQLSLTLLAGVVIGGLGSLVGAVWGAALLVFLPNWTTDLANSFSLSSNVSHNLPIAIYGLVLIAAMLLVADRDPGRRPCLGAQCGRLSSGRLGRAAAEPAGERCRRRGRGCQGITTVVVQPAELRGGRASGEGRPVPPCPMTRRRGAGAIPSRAAWTSRRRAWSPRIPTIVS